MSRTPREIMKAKTIKTVAIRLLVGTALHGTIHAGPAAQLYRPVSPLVVNQVQRPVRPIRRLVFTTPTGNTRRLGNPRLFNIGEAFISVAE